MCDGCLILRVPAQELPACLLRLGDGVLSVANQRLLRDSRVDPRLGQSWKARALLPLAMHRKFGLCRICVREMVHAGEIPGVTKASW